MRRSPLRHWPALAALTLGAASASVACSSPSTGPTTTGNPSSAPVTPTTPAPTTPTTPTTPVTPVPQGPTFVAASFAYGGRVFPYQVFVPTGYDPGKKWPVIVSIGGSGARGSDNKLHMTAGLPLIVKAKPANFPAIMVFPQVPLYGTDDPKVDTRNNATRAEFIAMFPRLMDEVMRTYSGDPDRIVLTGWSMGGVILYEVAYNEPTRYAAFMSVSGVICAWCMNGNSDSLPAVYSYNLIANRLKSFPIVHYHGTNDEVAPIAVIRQMKASFDAVNARFTLVELPGQTHNIQDTHYAKTDVQTWLLTQRRP